jgi:hypothetical protein
MKDEELLLTKKLDFDDVSEIINEYINLGYPRSQAIKKCMKDYKLTKKESNTLIDMIETQIKENFKNRISKVIPIGLERQENLYSLLMNKKNYVLAERTLNNYLKNIINIRNGMQNKNASNVYQNNKQININIQNYSAKELNKKLEIDSNE